MRTGAQPRPTRWRAIGRARGYSRRALWIISMAEATNRARSRWVLPPWEPSDKSRVVRSRQVAGVILPNRVVAIAQRMTDEGEDVARMFAREFAMRGFTRNDLDAHLDAIMAKDREA